VLSPRSALALALSLLTPACSCGAKPEGDEEGSLERTIAEALGVPEMPPAPHVEGGDGLPYRLNAAHYDAFLDASSFEITGSWAASGGPARVAAAPWAGQSLFRMDVEIAPVPNLRKLDPLAPPTVRLVVERVLDASGRDVHDPSGDSNQPMDGWVEVTDFE
jgi:hypothetical protein